MTLRLKLKHVTAVLWVMCAVLMLSATTYALDYKLYAGGSVGKHSLKDAGFRVIFEPSSATRMGVGAPYGKSWLSADKRSASAKKLFVGIRFSQMAIEFECADFGRIKTSGLVTAHNKTFTNTTYTSTSMSVYSDLKACAVNALKHWSVNDRVELFGMLGVARTKISSQVKLNSTALTETVISGSSIPAVSINQSRKVTVKNTSPKLGAGLDYQVGEHTLIRFQMERYLGFGGSKFVKKAYLDNVSLGIVVRQ